MLSWGPGSWPRVYTASMSRLTHHTHGVITDPSLLSPGDGLADQGHGGERREPGVAQGVEAPGAGQAQHWGRRGQGETRAH